MTALASSRPGGWDDPGAPPLPAPLRLVSVTVGSDWVDYNGHMSEWCYLLAIGDSSDAFFRYVGIDEQYRNAGHSLFTVQTQLRNLAEARLGERVDLSMQVLGVDDKRVHLAHELSCEQRLIATGEQLLLHVDTAAGRATPLPAVLADRIGQLVAAHARLGVPNWVGQGIRLGSRQG